MVGWILSLPNMSLYFTVVLDDASEEEREELFPDQGDKKTEPANRESRKEREEKLKQMMENDDGEGMYL